MAAKAALCQEDTRAAIRKCIHQENRVECRAFNKEQEANRTKDRRGSNSINSLIKTNKGGHRNGPQSMGSHSRPKIHSIQRDGSKCHIEAMLAEAGIGVEPEAG